MDTSRAGGGWGSGDSAGGGWGNSPGSQSRQRPSGAHTGEGQTAGVPPFAQETSPIIETEPITIAIAAFSAATALMLYTLQAGIMASMRAICASGYCAAL
jgi:hypothetical protein